jgi:hypothetical protein
MVATEVPESIVHLNVFSAVETNEAIEAYLVSRRLCILGVLEDNIVVRNKVERAAATFQIALENQTDTPSDVAVEFHDCLFEDCKLPAA